ncbi:BatD family protein [Thalassotalea agarivorans]|uniref:Oxygen tolerance n=1 Tax=Thalassotalea agarivorans TaxID=349064 RepID=A0A1I0ERQ2_THASX|nr:BatD family protein [Thalassotalea agarivorans]SET48043.1 Oxygen tolerance [Thalassotalea agarivorans]
MNKLLTTLLMLCTSFALNANTIETLIKNNELSVEFSISSKPPYMVKEPLILEVTIATNRWFAKGTDVRLPSMPNIVFMPVSGLAVNGTKQVNYETWATQTRYITIFPMRDGNYQLPAFRIFVSVNHDELGVVEGEYQTQSLAFSTELPEGLTENDAYFVSSNARISIKDDYQADKEYKIGEAVQKTLTVTATGIPAMMLPEFTVKQVDGISIYQKPAELSDKSNRGDIIGARTEQITYIFERPGNYTIPAQEIVWFNNELNMVQTLTIPEETWEISGGTLLDRLRAYKAAPLSQVPKQVILTAIIAILFVLLLIYAFIKRKQLAQFYKKITHYERRQQKSTYLSAIKSNNYQGALWALYRYYGSSQTATLTHLFASDTNKAVVFKQLLILAYGKSEETPLSLQQAKLLIEKTRANIKHIGFAQYEQKIKL